MRADENLEETIFSFSQEAPKPPERRSAPRHLTILRVGSLIVEGKRELCLIRNISAGGLLAHVYSPVAPEQKVLVELKSNQQIEGRIAWVKDENAGIAFDVPVDIAALLANPPVLPNGWRPRMPRVEVDRLATLRDGAVTHWVHIRDISQGGVKLECEQPLEIGTEIVITPEHFGPVAGTVRWQKDRFCGVSFNQLVPFDQLIAWLKRGS